MKILKLLSIFGILLGISLISLSIYLLTLKEETPVKPDTEISQDNQIEEVNEEENITEEVIVEEESVELLESGWIPNWTFDTGITSLENNIDIIDEVNPVLYTINSDGSLGGRNVSEKNIQQLQAIANENSILVIPTIGSYDFDSTTSLLNSTSAYKANISSLVSEIEKYDFDGIDLDYEQVQSKYKDAYILYLTELKEQLSKKEKILSVTVFPQWENGEYSKNKETVIVQNYEEIGKIADRVKIMAYDYTDSTSAKPGPIGPISWIEDVLKYAIKKIPKEKVYLGVHLYAYEWIGTEVKALTYASVKNILDSGSISSSFIEDIGEGYAKFSCVNGTKTCEMYFQNKEGIDIRRELAKEYGIQGISYWRLGQELDILK